jgi:hypothetical protein
VLALVTRDFVSPRTTLWFPAVCLPPNLSLSETERHWGHVLSVFASLHTIDFVSYMAVMTSALPKSTGGTYTFASQPRAVAPQRSSKYREPEQARDSQDPKYAAPAAQ